MAHELDGLDLNLMRLLKAVVDNRSIKLAAMQLGISQPSASRAVMKLKTILMILYLFAKPMALSHPPWLYDWQKCLMRCFIPLRKC